MNTLRRKIEIEVGTIITIAGIIFLAGSAYNQLTYLHQEVETVEKRLDKKIQLINANTESIHDIEVEVAKLHGE